VSMKNKFVTAVTTAGLLAGILGSAFVPSVKAAAGVLDATETTFVETDDLTGDGLLSTTPIQLVSATMAGVDHAGATITFTVEDSNGAVIPQNTVWTATASGSLRISKAVANVTSSSGYVGAAGEVVLNVAASSATATGTGTLTLTIGGGSETVYYRAVGAVSTITLANGGATALAGGVASEAGKITAATKDASGFALTAPADGDISWELATGSAGAAADVNEGGAAGVYDLTVDACDAAVSLTDVGDTAKSFTVRAKIGDLYSNYISVKCTDDGSFAKITGATASARSADVGGTITVTFTVQDGFGNALGYGAVVDIVGAGGHELAGAYYPTANAAAGDTKGSLAAAGLTGDVTISTVGSWTNVITVDSWARNAYVIYTLKDSDESTAEAQAWTKTFKFASVEPADEFEASISKSRFTVTADFGAAFKGKRISIVVENVATGSVVTYSRRANSLGKVSYTIGRRGSFEIYAMSGDTLTDTVLVKR
jgi:hypothetical protein